MALIPVDQLTVLKPASELAKVVNTAAEDQQLMKIAHALNTAANTGESSIRFHGEQMLDSVKAKLEAQGYHVQYSRNGAGYAYRISYKTSEEKK